MPEFTTTSRVAALFWALVALGIGGATATSCTLESDHPGGAGTAGDVGATAPPQPAPGRPAAAPANQGWGRPVPGGVPHLNPDDEGKLKEMAEVRKSGGTFTDGNITTRVSIEGNITRTEKYFDGELRLTAIEDTSDDSSTTLGALDDDGRPGYRATSRHERSKLIEVEAYDRDRDGVFEKEAELTTDFATRTITVVDRTRLVTDGGIVVTETTKTRPLRPNR